LLKQCSKAISKRKERKVIPLLGTIADYQMSKKKPIQQNNIENAERIEK
jgi:hypothetical protein